MADYTEAGKRLHMAYSFSLLTSRSAPAHLRGEVDALEREIARTGGWGCWALSNHDVPRIATRWSSTGQADPRQARMLLSMLLSLRGSVCLYQGEELGLPEAEVPFERLQDPYGMAFWPEFKGRDGCRTPMPWQALDGQGGFSPVEPWLPVSAAQRALAVDVQEADPDSTLHAARALLAWRRKSPVIRAGDLRFLDTDHADVLIFERALPATDAAPAERVLLAFNFSENAVSLPMPAGWSSATIAIDYDAPLSGARIDADAARLVLSPFGAFCSQASRTEH
jgi:alpha-glucosidase